MASSIIRSLALVMSILGLFLLIVPTFLSYIYHTTLFTIIQVSASFSHFTLTVPMPEVSGVETSRMGSLFPMIRAKWFLVTTPFTTFFQRLKTALGLL